MPAAPGGGQNEPDNSLAPLWITIGVMIGLGIIWFYFHKEIVAFIFRIRLWEADAISVFVPSIWAQQLDATKQYILTAQQAGYSGITVADALNVSNAVGEYLRYPVILVLGVFAVIAYLNNPASRFKKTHSMKSLLEHEKPIWPHIQPVANLDLIKQNIHKGPWAMAMNPMQFAKHHNLLKFDKKTSPLDRFETKQAPTADVLRDDARRVFALQLGRYWSGPEAMPIHMRALFAVFAARAMGDRDVAAKLQEQISRSSPTGKLNFAGADELLRKHKDNKNVIKICQKHAFEYTVMASMLEFGRQDGVLPSAEFLWLKPMDRKLWFLLNSVGRQTPFSEVAGIFGHWIAEKEFGKPLNVPMVEEAVNGLEIAMKEIIYHPDEEE